MNDRQVDLAVVPVDDRAMRLTSPGLRRLGRRLPTATARATAVELVGLVLTVVAVAGGALALDRLLTGRGTTAVPVSVALVAGLAAWWVSRRGRARSGQVAERTAATLRGDLFEHLCRLGPGPLLHHRTGELEVTLTDGVDGLADHYATFVPMAQASTVALAAAVGVLAAIDLPAGAIVAAAGLLALGAPVLTARAFGATGHRFALTIGATAAEYLDAIQGMTTLQSFGATRAWGAHLHDQFQDLAEDDTALAAMSNMHLGFTTVGLSAGLAAVVAVTATQTSHHQLGPTHLLWVAAASTVALVLVGRISHALTDAYRATTRADLILALLDTPPDVIESRHPVPVDRDRSRGSLRVEHLVFRYHPDAPPALDDVSFGVARGQLLAVVGPSGAGKSTLVSLLLRFFEPEAGRITLDGSDVRDLSLADLRRMVAVSFQDTYLFNRSVSQNLALGRPEASDEQIRAAARAAHAEDFIAALPDGYDTVLGERGRLLSGGQRQRLAIARALVSEAPVLVFDEPTSSVDEASEAAITEVLARLRTQRTVIVIAHRLSTIAEADQVVVIDGGRVVESGAPADLRGGSGAFAALTAAHRRAQEPAR